MSIIDCGHTCIFPCCMICYMIPPLQLKKIFLTHEDRITKQGKSPGHTRQLVISGWRAVPCEIKTLCVNFTLLQNKSQK